MAFALFGDSEVKKATLAADNPDTKYLKFYVGGSDGNRYPGFNGIIRQVFFSTKPGVFVDKEDEITGRLQAQKK